MIACGHSQGCSRGAMCTIPQHRRSTADPSVPCCFFLQGTCFKSAMQCQFRHQRILHKGCSKGNSCSIQAHHPGSDHRPQQSNVPCCFYLRGSCYNSGRGQCQFSHRRVFGQGCSKGNRCTIDSHRVQRAQCCYHLMGGCAKGDDCQFSHSLIYHAGCSRGERCREPGHQWVSRIHERQKMRGHSDDYDQ